MSAVIRDEQDPLPTAAVDGVLISDIVDVHIFKSSG